MTGNGEEPPYGTGYGKPPVNTRFKPGQSGNPKGRKKGIKNNTSILEEELNATIFITENGKRKKVSKRRAITKHTVNKALQGDMKAASIVVFDKTRQAEDRKVGADIPEFSAPDTQEIVLRAFARFQLTANAPKPDNTINKDTPHDSNA
jgi:hypothetical protein